MKIVRTIKNALNGIIDRIANTNWVDSPQAWKLIMFWSAPFAGLFLVIASFSGNDHSHIVEFSTIAGGALAFTAWISYCALEGFKREDAMKEVRAIEAARNCPDKVETPCGSGFSPSGR